MLQTHLSTINSDRAIVAGRPDGLGMMLCNFLYFSSIARKENKQLILAWPDKIPHLDDNQKTSLNRLFKRYGDHVTIVNADKISHGCKQKADTRAFLSEIVSLCEEFRNLEETDVISEACSSLPTYDYAIHARLGDVERKPLQHGGKNGRYFPIAGYRLVINKIINENPAASIFLCSNSDLALQLKNTYPHNISTEDDILQGIDRFTANSLEGNWLIIRQLSKVKHLISPKDSSFSLLGRISASSPIEHSTPGAFLNIEDLLDGMHIDYLSNAKALLPCCLANSKYWLGLLIRGWKGVPFLIKTETCLRILSQSSLFQVSPKSILDICIRPFLKYLIDIKSKISS